MAEASPDGRPRGAIGSVTKFLWNSATLLLCTASLFWALNPIIGRAVRDLITPVGLSFWRWTIAFFVVVAIAWPHLRRDWATIRENWKILVVLGLLGIGIFSTAVYWALRYTTAVNNLMMQSAMPPLILATSALLFRDRISKPQILGTMLSVAGLLVIVAQGRLDNLLALEFNRGDAASLFGVFLYALYSALLRKKPAIHPLSLLAALFAIGIATLAPAYIAEILDGRHLTARPETFLAIVYVAIFPSLLSYLFFNRSVELIGTARAGQFMNLPPVFGTVLAILLLGEHLELFHAAGAALVTVGIVLASRNAGGRVVEPDAVEAR